MSAQQPVVLKKDASWTPESVLIIECENKAEHMSNMRIHFKSADNQVLVKYCVFPHWPCLVPIPLNTAEGKVLHLNRTPGGFKKMVAGANLFFDDLEEVEVFPTEGAEECLVITRAEVVPEMPTEYPMPAEPLVDGLHQGRARDWEGKAASLEEVKQELEDELAGPEPSYPEGWSRFGGYEKKKFEATGFFRKECEDGTWWMVDPEGNVFWSMGVDCVRVGSGANVTGIEEVFEPALPSAEEAPQLWSERDGAKIFAGMHHNLERALGEDWFEKWMTLTKRRLKTKNINTIANWSDPRVFDKAGVPYVFTMRGFPVTQKTIFRDFPDVYSPEYEQNCTAFAAQLEKVKDEQLIIGYFMTNEPNWAFVKAFDIGKQLLMSAEPFTSLDVFIAGLKEKYGTIDKLNETWGGSLGAFEDLRNALDPRDLPGCGDDTMAFTEKAVARFVEVPAAACKKVDPNHMNLGLRWAYIHSDYQLAGAELLDAFSINCYQLKPDEELIASIVEKTGRPVVIGEFHIGTLDKGLPAGGIRNTRTMAESVDAYRYYVENGAAVPGLLGTHYFQWNDQHIMGRFDGENMQIGLHDITGRAYKEWTEVCQQVHPRVYEIRTGREEPFDREPDVVPNGTLAW